MAWEDYEYKTNNDPAGPAYARERDSWTRFARIPVDISKSKRGKGEENWSMDLGLVGKMQGGGADG